MANVVDVTTGPSPTTTDGPKKVARANSICRGRFTLVPIEKAFSVSVSPADGTSGFPSAHSPEQTDKSLWEKKDSEKTPSCNDDGTGEHAEQTDFSRHASCGSMGSSTLCSWAHTQNSSFVAPFDFVASHDIKGPPPSSSPPSSACTYAAFQAKHHAYNPSESHSAPIRRGQKTPSYSDVRMASCERPAPPHRATSFHERIRPNSVSAPVLPAVSAPLNVRRPSVAGAHTPTKESRLKQSFSYPMGPPATAGPERRRSIQYRTLSDPPTSSLYSIPSLDLFSSTPPEPSHPPRSQSAVSSPTKIGRVRSYTVSSTPSDGSGLSNALSSLAIQEQLGNLMQQQREAERRRDEQYSQLVSAIKTVSQQQDTQVTQLNRRMDTLYNGIAHTYLALTEAVRALNEIAAHSDHMGGANGAGNNDIFGAVCDKLVVADDLRRENSELSKRLKIGQ